MASKVITLPTVEAEAQQKLQEWLGKTDKVLFIVLGDTNIAFATVAKADVITGGVLQEPRWVIHATVRDWAIPILQTLADPKPCVTNWDSVLAIAVSITDVIRDMLPRDGSQPSNIKILSAFLKAEKNGRK